MCIMKQNLFALFLIVAMSLLSADQVFAANTGGCSTVGQACTGGVCTQSQETGDIYCQPTSCPTGYTCSENGCTGTTGAACGDFGVCCKPLTLDAQLKQGLDKSTITTTNICTTEGMICSLNSTTNGVCGRICTDGDCGLTCVAGSPSTGSTSSTTASPVPSTSGGSGSVTPSAGTSTASNRTSAPVTGGTSRGLYIPRGSEVGLSEMSVTSLIRNLLNWLLYIVGFVAIIAFVISGMQYLMAGADEEMAKKGKANMTYAIIGVLVALSALIIIRAIQSVLSGSWMF